MACRAVIMLSLALLLAGCGPNRGRFLNENDRLRRENMELEQQVAAMEREVAALRRTNQELSTRLNKALDLPDDVRLDMIPAPNRIAVGRYSGAIDKDRDGRLDLIRLYISVYDQQERFVPLAATATAQAVVIRPGAQPQIISDVQYSADDFKKAYRSGGLTGPHYTIELPLNEVPQNADTATVKVRIDPLTSELPLTTETNVSLKPPAL